MTGNLKVHAVPMLIQITMEKEMAKILMRLLVEELHRCNVRDEKFIEQLPEFRLYECLREFIGGKSYWELDFLFEKWWELSTCEQLEAIWGKQQKGEVNWIK